MAGAEPAGVRVDGGAGAAGVGAAPSGGGGASRLNREDHHQQAGRPTRGWRRCGCGWARAVGAPGGLLRGAPRGGGEEASVGVRVRDVLGEALRLRLGLPGGDPGRASARRAAKGWGRELPSGWGAGGRAGGRRFGCGWARDGGGPGASAGRRATRGWGRVLRSGWGAGRVGGGALAAVGMRVGEGAGAASAGRAAGRPSGRPVGRGWARAGGGPGRFRSGRAAEGRSRKAPRSRWWGGQGRLQRGEPLRAPVEESPSVAVGLALVKGRGGFGRGEPPEGRSRKARRCWRGSAVVVSPVSGVVPTGWGPSCRTTSSRSPGCPARAGRPRS